MRTFRSGDQLNHFFRAAEPVLHAFGIRAESLDGQLRGDARFGKPCIFRYEAKLVDTNSRGQLAAEKLFEALAEGADFRAGFHESFDEIVEFIPVNRGAKTDAGHTGGGKKVCKAPFSRGTFQGNAIQKELRTGGSEEKPGRAGRFYGLCKLMPGGIELVGGAGVP
ncbi:MAG TPA: hypothetical protein VEU52_11140 [Candidatus Limnocylindrales bacterium]|nr:hypothetical protein [Candidatus Limnocylindrales bacterium]